MSAIQPYIYLSGKTPLGPQQVVNLNYLALPFQVGLMVNVVSGSTTYNIDFTHADLSGDPAGFHWVNDVIGIPNGQSASRLFLINFPVTGLRINFQLLTGEVRLSAIQGLGTAP
jgi:hypothetical protein